MIKINKYFVQSKVVILLLLFLNMPTSPVLGALSDPISLTWEMLKDVSFKKKWYPNEGIFMLAPTFGNSLKSLEKKEVIIKGYIVPISAEENLYALSAFPYTSCFMCGAAGPESVISLKGKKLTQKFSTDEMHTFKGKLFLNGNDVYELTYILKDAEVVK